jgi:cytochrome c oxidase subunit IV
MHSESTNSTASYLVVYAALIVLTLATLALSFCELHQWHTIVGLAIATIKATLVTLFFMHLMQTARVAWLAFFAGLLWFAILLSLTLTDYLTRLWLIY